LIRREPITTMSGGAIGSQQKGLSDG